ncbi:hypothetical protein [Pedobacter antarcticus]|uniref:hypothetical protein n=1 Tax=Pedobacter antarcticus TaxID=34086 RepID=UPI00292D4DF5|nr:hypothetical protein [Pedobacter antarcticus]
MANQKTDSVDLKISLTSEAAVKNAEELVKKLSQTFAGGDTPNENEDPFTKLLKELDGLTRKEIFVKVREIKESYIKDLHQKPDEKGYTKKVATMNTEVDKLVGNNDFNKISESITRYKEALKAFPNNRDVKGVKDAHAAMYAAIGAGAENASKAVIALSGVFQNLGIGGDEFQQKMKAVSGILSGAGEIAKGIKDPAAIVTGSIKLLSSAIDLFNTKDKKLQLQIDAYKKNLDALGKAYKKLERDVNNSVGESVYADQLKQIENLKQQQADYQRMLDAERGKKKSDKGKIQEYQNAIDEIPNKIEDIDKAMSQNLLQGTFKDLSNSLADAFAEAFKGGEDGIKKMDGALNNFIANAIKNSLKLKILDPAVKKFTDDLSKYAKEHDNSVLGFNFEAYKKDLQIAGKLFGEGLEGAKEFFIEVKDSEAASPESMKGAFSTASQESISLLAGQTMGMRVAQLETNTLLTEQGKSIGDIYQIAKDKFEVQIKIERNTLRTANNTDRLDNIETQLIQMNRKMGDNENAVKTAGYA